MGSSTHLCIHSMCTARSNDSICTSIIASNVGSSIPYHPTQRQRTERINKMAIGISEDYFVIPKSDDFNVSRKDLDRDLQRLLSLQFNVLMSNGSDSEVHEKAYNEAYEKFLDKYSNER